MKIVKRIPQHQTFDKRVIKCFAWLPITISNKYQSETRWLETCYIEQQYEDICEHYGDPQWVNQRFI